MGTFQKNSTSGSPVALVEVRTVHNSHDDESSKIDYMLSVVGHQSPPSSTHNN